MLSYFAYHNNALEKQARAQQEQDDNLLSAAAIQKLEATQLNNSLVQSNSPSERANLKMNADTMLNIDVIDGENNLEPKVILKNAKQLSAAPIDIVDGTQKTHAYASKKNVAEGMMDIALLTANANQLRFLFTYNTESKTFYVSVGLIITSLVLQVAVGIALIFKRQMKIKGRKERADRTNDYLVGGVFLVTVINVFVASFTITESPKS